MGLNFSALKKITFGFMTGAAAMIWAAGMYYIIHSPRRNHLIQIFLISRTTLYLQDKPLWRLCFDVRHSFSPQRLDSDWSVSNDYPSHLIDVPDTFPILLATSSSHSVKSLLPSLVSSTPLPRHPRTCDHWSCLSSCSCPPSLRPLARPLSVSLQPSTNS